MGGTAFLGASSKKEKEMDWEKVINELNNQAKYIDEHGSNLGYEMRIQYRVSASTLRSIATSLKAGLVKK